MRPTLVIIALLFAFSRANAQTPPSISSAAHPAAAATAKPATAPSITTLQTVTVTGVVPGPSLWKVSHGDHVLWILGVVPTLPTGIQWRSTQVAQTIAASQAVIEQPDIKLKLDTNWFGKLFLLLPVYHAKRNPDGKTLRDVLPPALYARWYTQQQHYLPDDNGVVRLKPILAAAKLLKQALKVNGLRGNGEISDTVVALARQNNVKLIKPETTLEIHEPREAVKAFAASGPDGVACLGLVLDVVERGIPTIRARANAWATGDIETLRHVPEDPYHDACRSAITGAGFAHALGIDDLPARIENDWLSVADNALAANAQSFAVLPMNELLDPDGYLAALQARGFAVTTPDAQTNDDSALAHGTAAASIPASAASAH